MVILGIETSCDETAAALVENGTKILSNVVASSLPIHSKEGGVIPETAAREQLNDIIPVINLLFPTKAKLSAVDAIAVTFGPGLIGCLFVGVEAAKTLSYVLDKPIVPINHLIGHLYSAWLESPKPPKLPLVALIVSGGHTELLFVPDHGKFKHLGGTRDDAAGEAFDKIARLLGLGYPGGPAIEEQALKGDSAKYKLPRPLAKNPTYDFSFSGLKTATVNLVNQLSESKPLNATTKYDLAASVQEAIVDVLVEKTIRATKEYNVNNIVLGGGVAANKHLRAKMTSEYGGGVCFSSPKFAIDNGAMIASAAYFNFKPVKWDKVKADGAILF
ncbi:MAG: tRNA (adenosine(37)-N6)-threonylcarbamoyltransferase complex transferase subunit TsaD [Candidatus Woykebacteria bacterium RBG_16_43_9]|uniref:tRNA N6-adenosine threonylcarbamoyltransferase n=1 Tax=Candidatus Woykebacteria bacterium RBG_16_43_9 TaxID=1802596 RepID=A0A1G1WD30_9BACT|nr:MAG: tRNA (adenosine(37)-N6)-threonylcarbamoyltransferase complex transferase subunit TsaD [Candidatus Woykebacteria bacterium RBG_16_43_9]